MSLLFAIPDHPWVDTAEGAAVRIAVTVAEAGEHPGELRTVATEEPRDDGSSVVTFSAQTGRIAADLTTGANVAGAVALKANEGLSNQGVTPVGLGFRLTPEEAADIRHRAPTSVAVVKPYVNGKDLVQEPESRFIIDFFGLTEQETRDTYPELYQRVLTTVKPERDHQTRESYRRKWWIFAEPRANFRPALAGLPRYVATCRTAKHRIFTFLDGATVPDSKVVAIASDDAFVLGTLSSRVHGVWALASGAKLGLGNDPTYNNAESFAKFPFPACDEAAKARIRALGEELDAHRKRVQAQHPGLSLTAMYNVLEKLRGASAAVGQAPRLPEREAPAAASGALALQLTAKERVVHDAGLVSVLRQLHDELDAAVAAAYGWTPDLTDAEILTRLVALNAERAAEEAAGHIRWLRPDYQNPSGTTTQTRLEIAPAAATKAKGAGRKAKEPWPKPLAERVAATERALRAAAAPLTAAQLARRFARAKAEDVAEILDTLATLGRAHREGDTFRA